MCIPTMKQVIEETCVEDYEQRLFRAVMRQLTPAWAEVYERPEDFRDAGSGVGGFIYYSETEAFAQRHIADIVCVLADFEDDCGPLKKDRENPLNWYAWFALETTISRIMDYKENADDN